MHHPLYKDFGPFLRGIGADFQMEHLGISGSWQLHFCKKVLGVQKAKRSRSNHQIVAFRAASGLDTLAIPCKIMSWKSIMFNPPVVDPNQSSGVI